MGLVGAGYLAVLDNELNGPSTSPGDGGTSSNPQPTSVSDIARTRVGNAGVVSSFGWSTCASDRYGYAFDYPPEWQVWAPGPPEARLAACNEELDIIVLSPDIYSRSSPQINLYVYDQDVARGTVYEGFGTLDEYLDKAITTRSRVVKEFATSDGQRIVWLSDQRLVTAHSGVFYEFRPYRVEDVLLTKILSSLRFR